MSEFVESLRRLYINKLIGEEKIGALFDEGKINSEEKAYILDHT